MNPIRKKLLAVGVSVASVSILIMHMFENMPIFLMTIFTLTYLLGASTAILAVLTEDGDDDDHISFQHN